MNPMPPPIPDRPRRLVFDAHLDLAMNALEWNRDLTRPVEEIRVREHALRDKPDRGRGTVSLPEMRRGGVGVCVATQIARFVSPGSTLPGWHSPAQAWAQTQGQLAWYRAMEGAGEMALVAAAAALDALVRRWQEWLTQPRPDGSAAPDQPGVEPAARPPIGYVLSLEGADSLVTLDHLERAYAQGLRAVGPAHYGPGRYAQGTDATGGLGSRGRELLRAMDQLGMILDVTHLCDECFWEALDRFAGPIWASHSNCRALVPHHRQFADDQLKCLIERGAVIGLALDAWMLVPNWVRGTTTPQQAGVTLDHWADHIDHVCQLAGNARHAGIGSDLDGAFGREQTAADLDTIADLGSLAGRLRARGYGDADVDRILSGNFLGFLRHAWRA